MIARLILNWLELEKQVEMYERELIRRNVVRLTTNAVCFVWSHGGE